MPPCGVPLSVRPYFQSSRSSLQQVLEQAQETVVVELLAERRQQDIVVDVVKAPLDVALDEPLAVSIFAIYRTKEPEK